jgi:hypothetical protein
MRTPIRCIRDSTAEADVELDRKDFAIIGVCADMCELLYFTVDGDLKLR